MKQKKKIGEVSMADDLEGEQKKVHRHFTSYCKNDLILESEIKLQVKIMGQEL